MAGIRAPNSLLDFPGSNSDYSSFSSYGIPPYSPPNDYSLGMSRLPTQIGPAGSGSAAIARPDFFSWDGFFGGKNGDETSFNGWGGSALGALQGLGNAYMGMRQYGLAKDQFKFQKQAFEKNFNVQKGLTNARLEDRQRARVAANPNAYESVGDYMNKYGIK